MNSKFDEIIENFNRGNYEKALEKIEIYSTSDKNEIQRIEIVKAAVLLRSGKIKEANELMENLWEKKENQIADLYNLRGISLRSQGKLNQALEIFTEGIKKYNDSIDLAHNLSLTATDLAQYDVGIEYANKALSINPKFKETLKNLARIYITIRDVKNATETFEKLHKINEKGIDVLVGEGALDLIANRPSQAAKKFKKALKINPKSGPALANYGICCKYLGDYQNAKKYLQEACKSEPDQIEHPWNLSIVKLALGEYEDGWKEYEVRYDPRRIALDRVRLPNSQIPMLKPENTARGKRIIILQEQGFGDTFQFMRFAENLKKEGAKEIIALVAKEIVEVIRTIPWIDKVQSEIRQEELSPDYWVFPMSLPNRYKLRSPDEINYTSQYIKVSSDKKEKWQKYFDKNKKIKVGLIWAGRESHSNDENRSIELKELNRLIKFQNKIEFISLQKGEKQFQETGNDWKILRIGNDLKDFSDTAAVFSNLDLLISIDSGPIHLAGAMGMPVWVLIPKIFDFRWLIGREDTPWYPTMKLFRQKRAESWKNVIERLDKELNKFITRYENRWISSLIEVNKNVEKNSLAGVEFYIANAYKFHLEKNWNSAIKMYQMAITYDPMNIDANRNLASAYRSIGDIKNALKIYKKLEEIEIKDDLMYLNYSNLLVELEKINEAKDKLQKALIINPDNQIVKNTIIDLNNKFKYENKESHEKNLENTLKKIWDLTFSNKLVEARDLLENELIQRKPTIQMYIMAGIVYQELENFSLAEEYYKKAININQNFPEIYLNQAVLYAKQLQYKKAIDTINKCIQINPEHAEAHFHKSLYLLTLEIWKEGWEEYEWRMHPNRTAQEKIRKPMLSMPMWKGEEIKNKTILLMPEQGYGDYIQFIRYARYLSQLGAEVIAATREPLREIIKSCNGIKKVVGDGEKVTYHYWSFPMSLPYRLMNIVKNFDQFEDTTPYLYASKEKILKWQNWLNENKINLKNPIILLNWSGSKNHIRNEQRNIHFQEIKNLFSIKNVFFISINKNTNSEIYEDYKNPNFLNAGNDIKDFSDTAALLSLSNLLISIDSAPVHLAGAMGIENWILVDYIPDFRWGLNKNSTKWYPRSKIFRKSNDKNWKSAIEEVYKNLEIRFINYKY